MADFDTSCAPASALQDSSTLPFFAVNQGPWPPDGKDKGVLQADKTGNTAGNDAGAPLQLLPEIHGKPGPQDHSSGANGAGAKDNGAKRDHTATMDKASGNAVPLPRPRPELADKIPDQRALADKTLHAIAAADSSTMAQPSRDAQAVVKQFLQEKASLPDKEKPSALKKMGQIFDQTIREADNAYTQTESKADPGIKKARESYIVANSSYYQSFNDALESAKQLPTADQPKAALLLGAVKLDGAELPDKKELTKTFKNDPQFVQALVQLGIDQKGVFTASKSLEAANKPIVDAALEQDRARLAYERAAQSVGSYALAKSIDAERKLLAAQTLHLTKEPEEIRQVYGI